MVSRLQQNILAAVLSSVLGTKDPDQVNSMAKQAGEVKEHFDEFVIYNLKNKQTIKNIINGKIVRKQT